MKPDQDKSYTVSTRPTRGSKQVTFSIPTFKPRMPKISWRDLRARTRWGTAVVLIVLGAASGYGGALLQDHTSDNSGLLTSTVSGQKKIVTSTGQLISSIAKNVGQSVVSVNVNITDTSSNSYFGYFGFQQPSQDEQAAGTGIIISSSGLILTNRHVVPEGTTSVSVTLSDGTTFNNVQVVGRTSTNDSLDIAILKITNLNGHKLQPATLGDSSTVAVGDQVVAIGNALGQFQNTVTSGIISGYGRDITAQSSADSSDSESLDDMFQTDAAINEGNSGGPLVNLNGQVIGVNTAVASDSQNIGFAIPINDIKGLVQHVMDTGKFERPYLGVRYIPLTADVAAQYDLSVTNGAYIAPSADASQPSVVDGSPAASAGLKEGDVITKFNGTAIDESHSLTALLGKYEPGDKVELTVVNGSKTRTVTVTLGVAPTNTDTPTQQ